MKKIVRRKAVLDATGYSKSQLDDKIRKGEFPAPFKLSDGGRAVGWFEEDVARWQEERHAKRERGPQPKSETSPGA